MMYSMFLGISVQMRNIICLFSSIKIKDTCIVLYISSHGQFLLNWNFIQIFSNKQRQNINTRNEQQEAFKYFCVHINHLNKDLSWSLFEDSMEAYTLEGSRDNNRSLTKRVKLLMLVINRCIGFHIMNRHFFHLFCKLLSLVTNLSKKLPQI